MKTTEQYSNVFFIFMDSGDFFKHIQIQSILHFYKVYL